MCLPAVKPFSLCLHNEQTLCAFASQFLQLGVEFPFHLMKDTVLEIQADIESKDWYEDVKWLVQDLGRK